MTLTSVWRGACAVVVYGLCLFACFAVMVLYALVTNNDSLWPLVIVLGVPLAVTLYADRRWFR